MEAFDPKRICVTDALTLRGICYPILDEDVGSDCLDRDEIGAIVSIEQSPAQPGKFLESWRLSSVETAGFPRHFSTLFHSEAPGPAGLVDLFQSPHDVEWVIERAAALATDLSYMTDFLNSSYGKNKKLIIHCSRGMHRSPALALALLAQHLPEASETELLDTIQLICFNKIQLRAGELAFVDAFFGRDGKLVDAWSQISAPFYGNEGVFDLEKANSLQNNFREVLDPSLRSAVFEIKKRVLEL